MNILTHVRRPRAKLDRGDWVIDCDCGWSGRTCATAGTAVKKGAQIEGELEQAFRDHLPSHERVLYILVDQRQVEVPESNADDARLIMVPRGNFLMPIGTPVDLLKWYSADGQHYGRYMNRETGVVGDLVIGEVRTADNRVFKLDSDA